MKAALLFVTLVAAQDPAASGKPDPTKVEVVVDDMGSVGYRISDAQALAEIASSAMKERVGTEAVVYEGFLVASESLKKMLGPSAESQVTDDQIAYYQAAIGHAKTRVRVRFGKKKKTHWITLTCRKGDASPDDVLEKRELTGATFGEVREAMQQEMKTFCAAVVAKTPPAAAAGAPSSTAPPPPPGKKKREWTVPPRR